MPRSNAIPRQPKYVPPLFFIGGRLGNLYMHANRCIAERTNIYAPDQDLRWAKLYNRSLRQLFREVWACPVASEITDKVIQYAKFGSRFDLDDGRHSTVIDKNISIFIDPPTYFSLQWAYHFGNYEWEKRLKKNKQLHFRQTFNLLSEVGSSEQLFETKRQLHPLDVRNKKHEYRKRVQYKP